MAGTVVFLGAGATKACDGPLTDELLPQIYERARSGGSEAQKLVSFLGEHFHLSAGAAKEDFPGLPLLLSLLDTAVDRRQEFVPGWDAASISSVRKAVEYGIYDLLEVTLKTAPTSIHYELLNRLYPDGADIPCVITTNYDLITDTALMFLSESRSVGIGTGSGEGRLPYYGCQINAPLQESGKFGVMLKLHGSLNWLFCSTCSRLDLGISRAKSFLKVLSRIANGIDLNKAFTVDGDKCDMCGTRLLPLLVAPGHLKYYRNPHLSQVWYEAESALRRAEHVVFIGYSLPDDDVEVVYLLKHSLARASPPRITVVGYDGANPQIPINRHPVGRRYRALFGDAVEWHACGMYDWLFPAQARPAAYDALASRDLPVIEPTIAGRAGSVRDAILQDGDARIDVASRQYMKRQGAPSATELGTLRVHSPATGLTEVSMSTHAVLPGSQIDALPGARALGRTNPHTMVDVLLKLRRIAPLPELSGPVARPLTRAELGTRYGASRADADAVTAALAAHGVRVVRTDLATRTVEAHGTVVALESAFGVRLFNYAHADGPYRGRVGSVQVPFAVKDIVEGVFGLDSRRAVRRRRQPIRDSSAMRAAAAASIPAAWYQPSELAAHYQFPAGDGADQTVGILEFGGGYFSADLQRFCEITGTAVPTVTVVSTDGTPTDARDGAEGEVMLDIEVVAGVCPNATIAVYFGQFTTKGWISAIDAAVHDQSNDPGVVSVSWGYAENELIWTQQAVDQVNGALLEAAHLGITVCVAAGDDGSSDGITDGHAYADFPASSPYALAVGGTTIPQKGGAQPDIAWKEGDGLRADNGGSTGGGVSAFFERPAWQQAISVAPLNPNAIVGRVIPDITANADWDASPYLLVVDGKAQGNGGTSAATPLIASLLTLINAQKVAAGKSRIGFLTPLLYQAPAGSTAGTATVGLQACTDVTQGDNTTAAVGGFSAGIGYDAVSGWGTPIGTKLATLL